jgi:hypothetical protein
MAKSRPLKYRRCNYKEANASIVKKRKIVIEQILKIKKASSGQLKNFISRSE